MKRHSLSFVFKALFPTLAAVAALIPVSLSAQTALSELEDPQVNSINRLPARAYSMPLSDVKSAFTDALEPSTPYVKQLNGKWKISWSGDPAAREKDFWRTDYDDSLWETIDVPSCVETRGFGSPAYTNYVYPHARMQPLIRDVVTLQNDYNPVSSYRTSFTIPQSWKGRDVILRFDGVYSAYYVWVNGQKVGYAEDSKLPSEFDITKYLQKGENLLAVEVYRWCDGSYLEDQDMFRFSGIFRDVTLMAFPRKKINDFFFSYRLEKNYADAKATLKVDSDCQSASATLYDASGKAAATFSGKTSTKIIKGAHLWSAEDPYLYTLVIRSGSDIRSAKVGFCQIERSGNTVLVNGKQIKFKGVNRHEHSMYNGRTLTEKEMLEDILLMKRNNINTVRTCHYPDHHTWYDLCDKYGIYVMAEANVEGHGYGRNGSEGLGNKPEWVKPIVERNLNNVLNYRNHPSILFWSYGNETSNGICFKKAAEAVRSADPMRLTHWESGNADWEVGDSYADVDSKMYPSVEWLYERGRLGDELREPIQEGNDIQLKGHSKGKPLFVCEYAHAMGNSMGNFKEYWDVIYGSGSLLGGCVWDWVDQALCKPTGHFDSNGKALTYLSYGGDNGEIPNAGPFCCNGIIQPDRKPTPKLLEVSHVYRQIEVSSKDGRNAQVWNHFSFTGTDRFSASWTLLEDGVAVSSGQWNIPCVSPLQKSVVPLPETGYAFKAGREYFLNVSFAMKERTLWCEPGYVIASDQMALPSELVENQHKGNVKPVLSESDSEFKVVCGDIEALFSKSGKCMSDLRISDKPVMASGIGAPAAPHLTLMRAFVDNDKWLRDGKKQKSGYKNTFKTYGLTELRYHTLELSAVTAEDGSVDIRQLMNITGSKSAGFKIVTLYHFATDGTLTITTECDPYGHMPEALPRLGLLTLLDRRLENVTWYGRGPEENYIDRCSGSFIGRYESTVTDMYVNYIRPQDNGFRSDVRWVEFTDAEGDGVRFSGSEPLFVQALHYHWTDMVYARHIKGEESRVCLPAPSKEIYLNLDIRQLGLGGASCGPKPMDKYIFPIRKENWSVTVSAVKKK